MYLQVYSHVVHPVPGMHDWEETRKGAIGAPDVRLTRGRPKKRRRRRMDGNGILLGGTKASRRGLHVTCSICHAPGHNKRRHKKTSKGVSDAGVNAGGGEKFAEEAFGGFGAQSQPPRAPTQLVTHQPPRAQSQPLRAQSQPKKPRKQSIPKRKKDQPSSSNTVPSQPV